ncbi:MAG: alkaline phosphatase family protein [Planctomycetota bacterium]
MNRIGRQMCVCPARFAHTRLARLLFEALFVCTLLLGLGGCDDKGDAGGKKVLVLGCDGMDPVLVGRMLEEGRLPNFAKLRDEGCFHPLTTSIPPQSPVAWSNFITGAGPGVHGIFDFIHRDASGQVPIPYWSGNKIKVLGEKDPIGLFGEYEYPRIEARNELLRRGTPFWEHLDARGIPVQMYRLPSNYPPSESKYGNVKCLAGMGVPDVMGSQGTYQHFAAQTRREVLEPRGFQLRLRHDWKSGAYISKLYGPDNDLHVPVKDSRTGREERPRLFVDLKIYPDPENDVAKIIFVNQSVLGDEEVEIILSVGEWSGWQEVHFLKTPAGLSVSALTRFLLQEAHPTVRLYASPMNFVPTAPEAVFSEPPKFVEEIGEEIGPFYTQGFAEEFNALKHGLFTDEEYRIQSGYVMEERFKLLDYALNHFEEGMLFFYFSSTDLQAHMFWWDSDESHPTRSAEEAEKYNAVVEACYEKMDEALGRCRERLGEDATIMVMSDHGFGNFKRGFGVNTWLRDEGYLVSRNNRGVLIDTDWSRTRAYSYGVGGSIYLNLKGREQQGIVEESDRDRLIEEISTKLMGVIDPENGRPVFHRVYRADECYSGPEVKNAPDLILGYARGYRASWETCLGDFDKTIVMDNDNPWSADHCIAHDLVPGILFCNREIATETPALIDMAPSILTLFGVPTPDGMTGKSFFKASPKGSRD